MDEEDVIMPEEEVEATPAEPTEQAEEPQISGTSSEAKPAEPTDEQKLLDFLNTKDIKYNGEKVTVSSIDELINNYQKGMNYDKLKAKTDSETDYAMSYLNEKAKLLGCTTKEYIDRVKEYEKKQETELMQKDIEQMVANGIDEVTARRVAETEAARKEFEKEKAEYQKLKEAEVAKQKENQEYEDFINNHPDVKPEEIPEEVFKEAKEIGLNAAYEKYENKLLKEKIKQMEQNTQNASNSPVRTDFQRKPNRAREQGCIFGRF